MLGALTLFPLTAVEDCHKLLLWLIPKINQFPKAHLISLNNYKKAMIIYLNGISAES